MDFLLIPGAGGEAWYWHRVVPELEARGHGVVAVDFPAADESAGLREYADVAAAAAGEREDLVVVSQSMGAFVAPLLCGRLDVRRLILVVPMIPAPGESPSQWWSSSGESAARRENEEREGRDPDAPFDPMTAFFHDVPQDVVDEATARGEPRQADRPFEEPWPLDAWPDVPTHVVAGRHDRLFPLAFMQRLSRERLGVEPAVIDAGHLPALARPRELADIVDAYAPQ